MSILREVCNVSHHAFLQSSAQLYRIKKIWLHSIKNNNSLRNLSIPPEKLTAGTITKSLKTACSSVFVYFIRSGISRPFIVYHIRLSWRSMQQPITFIPSVTPGSFSISAEVDYKTCIEVLHVKIQLYNWNYVYRHICYMHITTFTLPSNNSFLRKFSNYSLLM